MNHRFTKEERLCSKSLIDRLFHNGSSFVIYPYRVVFLTSQEDKTSPIQCIISVSKRRFKKAVDRNYIKRRMREAYRLQKHQLYPFLQQHSLHLLVAFQYVGKEKLTYEYLVKRMELVLNRLRDESVEVYLEKDD